MNKWLHRIVVFFGFPVILLIGVIAVTLLVLGELIDYTTEKKRLANMH